MDGVLWQDQTPIGNLKELFKILNVDNIQYSFATNNSTKTINEYQVRLEDMGIPVKSESIVTSGTTIARMLLEYFPSGGPIFILGENGLNETLNEFGFYHEERNAIAVVGGLDRQINYEKLKRATLLLQKLPFFYTNADTTFPTPDGIIPGAGSILRALEIGSGNNAIVAGKPKPIMFQHAMQIMGDPPEETMVIGDRLDTDILGGLNAGCFTAMVLSGISSKEDLEISTYQPHWVFNELSDLIQHFHEIHWEINT